jgi:PLP dependent protein
VNASGEATKAGTPPSEAPALVDGLRDLGLDVQGLMTIAPAGPAAAARATFRRLREVAGSLGLRELSMGMSGDLEVAVEEGATMVRVGTDLFGPRPDPPGARH